MQLDQNPVIRAGLDPEDLACTGITFQSDNEAYRLPFVLSAWVIE